MLGWVVILRASGFPSKEKAEAWARAEYGHLFIAVQSEVSWKLSEDERSANRANLRRQGVDPRDGD